MDEFKRNPYSWRTEITIKRTIKRTILGRFNKRKIIWECQGINVLFFSFFFLSFPTVCAYFYRRSNVIALVREIDGLHDLRN